MKCCEYGSMGCIHSTFNKLECLFHEGLSNLVYYMWERPGANHRVEHLNGTPLGLTLALFPNNRLGWIGLPGTHTSVIGPFINYKGNEVL